MIEINLTIVIQVLQFLILVFVLNRLLFKPISQVMAERQKKISDWEVKTQSLKESVRTRIESYETHLQEARMQAQEQQEQLSDEVKEKEEERIGQISEEANRMVASTKKALEEETERLRVELRKQAAELSQIMAEKVLGRKVS
jgi:F-type H+-transporting ATPase subunit b